LRTHHPTTTTALYEPPHHLPASPHTAVSHGTPETKRQTLGFGFLAYTSPPGLALAHT
jgi:hypothetical protein